MDLFTHVLVAYLVTFGLVGFQPAYLAAGALGGGLPDADALFFPIAKRFPVLRHHGITHSVFGVSVVAGAGALIAPLLAPGSALVYFLVLEVGGLCHIAQDGFTHFSVPPLLPFSERRLELDADRAINFVTLLVSVASFYLLLGVERNRVPFSDYLLTVYALMVFFAAYFAVRLAGRLVVGRRLHALGDYDVVAPTSNPFAWLVLSERDGGGRHRTTWARYVFGRGIVAGPFTAEGLLEPPAGGGVPSTAAEALAWSYPLARRTSGVLEATYHFGEASADGVGGWTAVWYSLEFTFLGRAAGVRVRFPPDGGPASAHRAFYRPSVRPG
ncbi:MAG TPA: metal-dependent hydrolase [Thermoplasmata archaeon]|nr:metal-dependent hydrolase [Thermoplasmata archaeon]